MDIEFLERILPESIPFPFSRSYSFFARSRIMRDFYKQVASEVAQHRRGGMILDIGTGPGFLPIELAKLIGGAEVVGIDLSRDMIKIAERNARIEEIHGKVKFLVMDANSMNFDDSSFDLVLSTGALHHWKNPLRAIREIRRVLREGGQAWIYDLSKDASSELLAAKLLEYGYSKFLSTFIFRIVKLHSGLTLKELRRIAEEASGIFRNYIIIENWRSFPALKLELHT